MPEKRLHYAKFSFPSALDDVVKYGWVMHSQEPIQADRDLLIPDGYPEIIFVLRGAYAKRPIHAQEEVSIIKQSCVIGIQDQTILANRMNHCFLVGLKLYPWGAYRLLGKELALAANHNIIFEQMAIPWLERLKDQLTVDKSQEELTNLISKSLLSQIEQQDSKRSWQEAKMLLQPILKTKGQISVQALAKLCFLSVRQLQRKFKAFYGITPKKFINIIRFKHLYKGTVLQNGIPDDYLAHGYYDQMHFIKDYQKQLGITPSKTLEEAFQNRNRIARRSS